MKYTAVISGKQVEVEFEQTGPHKLKARVADRTYTLDAIAVEPGVYWINHDNRSIEVTITPRIDGYTVTIGRQRLSAEILDTRAILRKAAHHGHDGIVEVRAPMPGKVVKTLVAEGEEIHANQGILVMEAMKMQNEIKSPKKGIVKKLHATEGLAVNYGDVLFSVE